MPLLNTSIPNLSQGVSQQPDNLRFPGQHDAQENALSSVVDGLRKRPFTEFVGELGSDRKIHPDSFVYFINRDSDNRHLLVIEPSGELQNPKIYNTTDGSSVNLYDASTGTSTTGINPSYLQVTNPRENLRALTVADTTFILNKTQNISALGTNSDAQAKKAVVFVKQGDYLKNYHVDITINGTSTHCTYKSGDGSSNNKAEINGIVAASPGIGNSNGDANDASTELIAQGIFGAIIDRGISDIVVTLAHLDGVDNLSANDDFSNATNGNAVLIEYTGGSTFSVDTHDGLSDLGLGVIMNSVGSVTDLPVSTFEEQKVKVTGDIEQASDDYYVGTSANDGVAFSGIIDSLSIVAGGSGYTAGTHNLIFTGGGATTQATGTFTVSNYGGLYKVDSITLTSGGTGYTSTPEIDFSNGGGTGAVANCILFHYKNCTWQETIAYSTPTALTATDMPYKLLPQSHFYIDSTNIVDGGSSYTDGTFALGFTGGGTPTTEAEGTFTVVSNVITSINITNPGAGYSSAPTLDFSASAGGSGEDVTVTMSDGESYYIDTNTWGTRLVGDTETNPDPSFVGSTIENIFFWKNRLGFLSGQNIIFSEADNYFNFFRTTVLQLLDSALIDVGISHTRVSFLKNVATFQERLVVFSDETQFIIKGNELLTPSTINVTPSTEYEALDGVPPLSLGNFIYFPVPRNSYNGVNEYYIDATTNTNKADEITGHVPKYIPANIKQLIGSSTEGVIIATTTDTSGSKDMYVYKYFWRGQDRVQSAWSKFTFADDIVHAFFIEGDLYIVTEDGTSTHLEKMSLESGLVDTGESYAIHIDKRRAVSSLSPSYDSATNKTTIDAGYPIANAEVWSQGGTKATKDASSSGNTIVVNGDYTQEPTLDFSASSGGSGASGTISYDSDGTITGISVAAGGSSYTNGIGFTLTITGGNPTTAATATFDVSGGAVTAITVTDGGAGYQREAYVGIPYTMSVTLTNPAVKQQADGGGRSVSAFNRQIVRNGSVEYANTGHFKVNVATKFRPSYEHIYNATTLGSDAQLGQLVLQDGTFRFPIFANINDITVTLSSDSALPVQFLSTEFENTVSARSRRIAS